MGHVVDAKVVCDAIIENITYLEKVLDFWQSSIPAYHAIGERAKMLLHVTVDATACSVDATACSVDATVCTGVVDPVFF